MKEEEDDYSHIAKEENEGREKRINEEDINDLYAYMNEQLRKVNTRVDRIETNQSDMNLVFNVIKGGGVLPYEFASISKKKAQRKERYDSLIGSGGDYNTTIIEEEEDADSTSSSSQAEHYSYCPFYFTCCGCTTT